jgi:hypothetical protein
VLDDLLLAKIDPAGQDQEQQLPGLQTGFYISPNAVCKNAASGIRGSLSTVRNGAARALAGVVGSATCSSAEFLYPAG